MTTIAEIYVAVLPDTSKTGAILRRELGRIDTAAPAQKAGQKAGDGFAAGFGRSTKKVVGLVGGLLASREAVQGAKASIDAASDLNETINKTDVIFGKNAKTIKAWSATSERSLGLSQGKALAAAASFGDMFTQLGFTGKQATTMSKSTVKLAADLGSFNNLGTDDVLDRISAAFRGEYDSLQAVIPNINAARVEKEALAATGKKVAKELTAEEKAAATLAIIQKDGARAAGDFARTSGGVANQSKITTALTERLKVSIGKGLTPAYAQAQKVLNDEVLPGLIAFSDKHGPKVAKFLTELGPKVAASLSLITTGDFNAKIRKQLGGLEEDSGYVTGILRIRDAAVSLRGAFDILAKGDYTRKIFGQGEDSKTVDVLFKVRDAVGALDERIKGMDKQKLSEMFASVVDSAGKLIPVVQEFIDQMPGVTSTVDVAVKALAFLADHSDTLIKIMPLLVAAVVAYKAAQLAANLAQAVAVPAKVAEVVVNRQLVKSNRELIASRGSLVAATVGQTVATSANTAATATNASTTLRQRAAAVASAAAQRGIAAATAAWTVVQRALNIALIANPIGLIITALGLLAVGLVVAYKKSETFRNIVNGAFGGVKTVAVAALKFVINTFLNFVSTILTGASKAFGWVPELGPKLKGAADAFGRFRDDVNRKLDGINDEAINVALKYSASGVNLSAPSSVGRRATGGPGGPVRGPGTTTNDKAGLFALSKYEWVIRAMSSMKYGSRRMKAINDGTATVLAPDEVAGMATGGGINVRSRIPGAASIQSVTSGVAKVLGREIAKAQARAGINPGLGGVLDFVRSMAGRVPYLWGGMSRAGLDCSGLVSAAINKAYGREPFRRLGSTGSMPWSSMAPGPGAFMVGWFKGNPGHTAATVNGVNIESAGGVGVRMGAKARGAMSSLFTNRMHVKGFARGGSPKDGDAPWDLLNPSGQRFIGYDLAEALGRGVLLRDRGGDLPRGTSIVQNNTNRPERILSSAEESRLKTLQGLLTKNLELFTAAIGKNVEKINDLLGKYHEFAAATTSSFTGALFGSGSVADLGLKLQARRNDANGFQKSLKTLKAKGLNTALWKELAGSSDYAAAAQLAQMSRSEIATLNRQYVAAGKAVTTLGNYAGNAVYGNAIRSEQAVLRKRQETRADIVTALKQVRFRLDMGNGRTAYATLMSNS